MSRFIARWPVVDWRPMPELVAEALEDLPWLLTVGRASLTGRVRWSLRRGQDVPGSGGAEWVLCADAPAVERVRLDDTEAA